MTQKFTNEIITVAGREVEGTVTVYSHATDASFSFSQGSINGTHEEWDVEHTIESFEPVKPVTLDEQALDRALDQWLDANQRKIEKGLNR